MTHPPYTRILMPHDFSEPARLALAEAVRVASLCGARLRLLHAYQMPVVPTGTGAAGPGVPDSLASPDLDATLRDSAGKALEREAEAARREGLEVEVEVGAGAPEQVIGDVARTWEADLLVMGTRGATGLAHVLLGSVAERTVRSAPCPVLTVRDVVDDDD